MGLWRWGLWQIRNWFFYGKILPPGRLLMLEKTFRNPVRINRSLLFCLISNSEQEHASYQFLIYTVHELILTEFFSLMHLQVLLKCTVDEILFLVVPVFRKWSSCATRELRRSAVELSFLWRWPVMDMCTHLDKVQFHM